MGVCCYSAEAGGGEHSTHAAAHPGEEKNYMQMDLACTTESCGVPEACAAETDVGMWQVLGGLFALRTQAQMSTENMADTSHAEGRGGRGKSNFWPAPGTLQETLTLTTSMSI